jgi:hypothetical protein
MCWNYPKLAVAFIDKHLASVEDGGLKTVKCSYIHNNTSFWQGNISTKFIGKRVSWWQILDQTESKKVNSNGQNNNGGRNNITVVGMNHDHSI